MQRTKKFVGYELGQRREGVVMAELADRLASSWIREALSSVAQQPTGAGGAVIFDRDRGLAGFDLGLEDDQID